MKFSEKVYIQASKIPKGSISTYGEIARSLNSKAYRAVGNALNKNPYSPDVPCHRVIKSSGEIGGFSKGIKEKIRLLKNEKITIKNNKIDLLKYLHKFR